MSDIENNEEAQTEIPQISELDALKQRADLMGLSYHPNIGVDKLRTKVQAALDGKADPTEDGIGGAVNTESSVAAAPIVENEGQKRMRMKQEANKLVRIKVSCRNPAKKEWDGEIFATGNSVIGTFKKYVPFDNEEGWHVPQIIYQMIKDREYQYFVEVTKEVAGRRVKTKEGRTGKEFLVEVMDPLTPQEIKELAQRQAMRDGTAAA